MSEIDAMKALEEALEKLDEAACRRVLAWANSRYLMEPIADLTHSDSANAATSGKGKKAVKKSTSSSKGTSKKAIISIDKTIDLHPAGKMSAEEFGLAKSPTNVKEKCVVAAYYLRDFTEVSSVSISAVYTFFKAVGWVLPKDLKNMLQQAGSMGWLDTSNSDALLITSIGENLVEHKLPKSGK